MDSDGITWAYNGYEFILDMLDLETAEHYTRVFNDYSAKESALQKKRKSMSLPEAIREYCTICSGMFDALFGEGTSVKLFGSKLNARLCDNALDSFMKFVGAQITGILHRREILSTEFSPARIRQSVKKD